ncbi:hypothetical protein ACHAW5_004359 [Stephanodiscus triporus]|uniref:FAD-binding domain-containing protein n=1 Tax=Stephanodiscus triporus TaxID=2934178 RepID=A0ABD3Q467_9STRA
MCRPPANDAPHADAPPPRVCRVLIAGAGPAGLLLHALLHHRNKSSASRAGVTYRVTIVDGRQDLGLLTPEELRANHRSWMIGLSGHGLEAVRSVPGLWEDYLSEGVGVKLMEASLILGSRKINATQPEAEGFIVDRNFIVAAMARYARDRIWSLSTDHVFRYGTDLLYVDHDNRRVLLRDRATKVEEYASYDLLVGADGVRSVVREALVKRHVDTELQTNDMINLSMGVPRNLFNAISDDLKSDDPTVVAAYLRKNFKAFELDSNDAYLDWATQWVNQRWNLTGQVHCNRYHSVECGIVMMGDSVHATSPSIGMGMNTALRDAQKFLELLEEYDDNLDAVLPRYSVDRVPEGNALTNLAMNLFCFNTRVYMKTLVKSIVRSGLNYIFPKFVDPDPNALLGRPEHTLSYVYNMAVDQGIIVRHREINMRIRQEFFERRTGMVTIKEKKNSLVSLAMYVALAAIVPAAIMAGKNNI